STSSTSAAVRHSTAPTDVSSSRIGATRYSGYGIRTRPPTFSIRPGRSRGGVRTGVEAGPLEGDAQGFERRAGLGRIVCSPDQPVDRIHAKADGLHVKRRGGPPQGLCFFEQFVAVLPGRQGLEQRQQTIENRQ